MVFLEHRPRVYYILSYYSSRSHGTVVCTATCKGRNIIIVHHVTPPHGIKWLLCRMIVRELRQYRCQQPPVRASFQGKSVLVPH